MADAEVLAQLARIDAKLDRLIEDVMAPPRAGQAGGLLSRQAASEQAIDAIRTALADLEEAVEALKAEPGRRAIAWSDWLRLTVAGLVLSGVAGLVGAQVSGRHP